MKKPVYSVRDSKAETWTFPFQSENNATAIRDFQTLVKDGRTLVGQHPEDFSLFLIGEYDFTTGIFINGVQQVHLACGSDFVKGE